MKTNNDVATTESNNCACHCQCCNSECQCASQTSVCCEDDKCDCVPTSGCGC